MDIQTQNQEYVDDSRAVRAAEDLQFFIQNNTSKITTGTKMDIQTLIQEYVDDNGAVGTAIGLIDHGKVQFFCYGKKSIQADEPISENTVFEIGSITKVFTTLVLMDMMTKGEVRLDEPIETYLPGVRVPEIDEKKITLRHLATHRSGLPSLPDNFNPKNPMNPYEDYTVENLYDFLNHYTLPRAPAEQFEYSNIGMGLLGHILSRKAGQSYEALVRSRICDPLEMKSTVISMTPDMEQNFAKGYHLKQEVSHFDIPTLAGAGALRSNIKDMTRFLSVNMGLFNSSVTDLLKECHKQQYKAGPMGDIGLGWMIDHSKDGDIVWHNGGTYGFRTFLGFNTKTQKGIVVLSNSSDGWPDAFALRILAPAVYTPPAADKTLENDLTYLKRFAGAYEGITLHDQQKLPITIKLSDSQLIFSLPHGELKLVPESHGVFSLKGSPGQKLHFIFDKDGNVEKAQMLLPENVIAAEIFPHLEEH
jgi:serine-type D-Ala-D-Ala carboxypeptidase/endopeptidase